MEDILGVYTRPYDPDMPVICMDESNKQLVSQVKAPLPLAPGKPLRTDDEYVRHGVADIFMAVEPMAGNRLVKVTQTRTHLDWALFIKALLENAYPTATKVVLVMDNLNTHGISSLYEAFHPKLNDYLASRLEIHFTPKHGSWLNMAEFELSALLSQCLSRRIPDIETMRNEVEAWMLARNQEGADIQWRFTKADARIKLRRLYPKNRLDGVKGA
jgi:transposase